MTPGRQRRNGHVGPARQLEAFLNVQAPGLLSHLHGIFIDQDMGDNTGAWTGDGNSVEPPITGASRPCAFVPGRMNQEALAFNTTHAPRIGGLSREEWREETVGVLTHEVQHVIFDSAPHRATAAGCPRSTVERELSELNAILSEFPVHYRAIPLGAPASHPARRRLAQWFRESITNPYESIQGTLRAMRCRCDCADVDLYIQDTLSFVSAAWSSAERAALVAELRQPHWGLAWP